MLVAQALNYIARSSEWYGRLAAPACRRIRGWELLDELESVEVAEVRVWQLRRAPR